MDKLSEKERSAFLEFKAAVQDIIQPHHDDEYMLTWLHARNYNPKKAEAMYRRSMAWRVEHQVDNILQEYETPEVMQKFWQGGHCGYTKDGHPVWYNIAKDFDFKGHIRSSRKSEIIRYHIYHMEKIMRECNHQSQKMGHKVIGAMQISDMKDFNLMAYLTAGVEVFNKVLAMFEANYPGFLTAAYVINAPRVFPIVYNFLKPFMSEDTKRKVHICGRNWREELLSVIDEADLPVCYGGKRTDPDGDPRCRSWIVYPVAVPKTYYLSEQNLFDTEKCQETVISRGESLRIPYLVSQSETVIRWIYKTENNDVGFAVYRETCPGQDVKDMEEIVKLTRKNCNLIPEEGSKSLENTGTYVVLFDNTYSWLTSKNLTYQIELLEPAQEIADEMTDLDLRSSPSNS